MPIAKIQVAYNVGNRRNKKFSILDASVRMLGKRLVVKERTYQNGDGSFTTTESQTYVAGDMSVDDAIAQIRENIHAVGLSHFVDIHNMAEDLHIRAKTRPTEADSISKDEQKAIVSTMMSRGDNVAACEILLTKSSKKRTAALIAYRDSKNLMEETQVVADEPSDGE